MDCDWVATESTEVTMSTAEDQNHAEDENHDHAEDQNHADEPGEDHNQNHERGLLLLMVGTARSSQGVTKEMLAHRIYNMLQDARGGKASLHAAGQREGGWCCKQFLMTELEAGQKSWKHFKRAYSQQIELDAPQQWVRLLPSQAAAKREDQNQNHAKDPGEDQNQIAVYDTISNPGSEPSCYGRKRSESFLRCPRLQSLN